MNTRSLQLIFCLIPLLLRADIKKKMDGWFDNMNTVVHTNSAESVNSDLGVNFLGGTGLVRTNVYDISPAHVSLPTISAGCGGIDYTMGAINIASKQEMLKALKSVLSNAGTYAFLLGLETTSPMVASTVKQIQGWANQLNAININSCELGTSLVQGVWPKTDASKKFICAHSGDGNRIFRDMVESRHRCHEGSSVDKGAQAAEARAKDNPDFFVGDYNIAWTALEKFKDLDPQTKQLFLNLAGTIVVKDKQITVYRPRSTEALGLMQHGGHLRDAYKFNEDQKGGFVGIVLENFSLAPEHSWYYRVHKMLLSIQSKISEEKGGRSQLSAEESSLLKTSRFPIGSLTSLMAQWSGKGASVTSLSECAEIIAFEQVSDFLRDVLMTILTRAESLRKIQVDGVALDDYIKHLEAARFELSELQTKNYQRMAVKSEQIRFLLEIDKNQRDQTRGPL